MNDTPVKLTTKDVISLGAFVVLIAIQWGMNSSRIAIAEERLGKVETSDREQQKNDADIKVKLMGIEKDVQQIRKDSDEHKTMLNKVLEELRSGKK